MDGVIHKVLVWTRDSALPVRVILLYSHHRSVSRLSLRGVFVESFGFRIPIVIQVWFILVYPGIHGVGVVDTNCYAWEEVNLFATGADGAGVSWFDFDFIFWSAHQCNNKTNYQPYSHHMHPPNHKLQGLSPTSHWTYSGSPSNTQQYSVYSPCLKNNSLYYVLIGMDGIMVLEC